MTISSGLGLPEIEAPFARQLLKFTVPKLASGKTPPEPEGASAIHSAEPSLALREDCFVVNDQCCVLSAMVSVKLPLPLVVTEALMASPGRTGLERFTGNLGYISYQA